MSTERKQDAPTERKEKGIMLRSHLPAIQTIHYQNNINLLLHS